VNKLNNIVKLINSQGYTLEKHVKELFNKLPQDLEETAKAHGALIRLRNIKSAYELILALFIYASANVSQKILAANMAIMGFANISDQAWQKKIIRCESWLAHLMKEMMPKISKKGKAPFEAKSGKKLKILDGSIILQCGTKSKRGGETLRMHLCYNLTDGHMDHVKVTDKHTAEGVSMFEIEPNTIYMADALYGKGKHAAHIVSKKADAIFRVTPNHLSLFEDELGNNKIDMAQKLESTKADLIDFGCFVFAWKKKYIKVRIIASRLPEEKAALVRERKMKGAKKRQTKDMRPQTLIYAGWTILMTTLDSAHSADEILHLYRQRWQIEVLFKHIKQSFSVSKLPAASLAHSKIMVHLWLILWSLTEQNAMVMEIALLQKEVDLTDITSWFTHSFLLKQLISIINCLWALAFCIEDDALLVFSRLKEHRSSRTNQLATFRFIG